MYAGIIGFILGLLTRIKNQPEGKPATHKSEQQNTQADSRPIIVTYSPPALTDQERAEKEDEKRRNKLKFRLEVAGFIVLTLYTGFTGFMYWEMKESTKTAKRQFDMSERPWVTADLVSVGPITYDDPKRVKIQFAIKIVNIGHSPAINVNIFPRIKDRMSGPGDPVEQQQKPCAGAEAIKLDQHWGRTLFPGRDYTETFLFDLTREEVGPDFQLSPEIRPKDNWEPNVLGCVDYTVSFSGEHHQTYFIYDLWGMTDSGSITRLVMGVKTPAEKIRFFTNSPFSGGAN
ncbi:MAG TPA: hypothetical protein VGQ12_19840 [Candidatus Angelobacter sp.]|jgi:hypothetical protein|nr:hypothetical protein [Candidatus Angelobacter sp.]